MAVGRYCSMATRTGNAARLSGLLAGSELQSFVATLSRYPSKALPGSVGSFCYGLIWIASSLCKGAGREGVCDRVEIGPDLGQGPSMRGWTRGTSSFISVRLAPSSIRRSFPGPQ